MHKYDKKQPSSSDIRDSIPDSWYYNDATATQVWKDMETIYDVAKAEQKRQERESTLRKIDTSAHKLHQMITGFEISDQEFLMNLMDILDDDTAVDNVDRQSILMEARYRLSEILQEHSQSTEAQEKMIESLREWFMSVMQDQDDGFPRFREREPFSASELRDMINVLCEKQELVTEEASNLHSTITNELQRRIRDLQRDLEAKNVEIARLKEQLEQQKSSRRRGGVYGKRPSLKKSDAVVALSSAQRKIAEQEGKIENLKQALAASGKEYDPDKASIADSASNFSVGSYMPYDREMEYESRIRYLTEQMTGLKSECSNYQAQLNSAKVAEVDLKNRLSSMERLKKNMEEQVAALNQKYATMEEGFEKKIAVLEKQSHGDDSQSIVEMKASFEKQLAEVKEEAVRRHQSSIEQIEKRHKGHVADLLKAIKGGDHQVVVQTLLEQNEAKSRDSMQTYEKQMNELKQAQTDKILSLTRMYEDKLKLATINSDNMKAVFQSDLETKLMNQKIELENSFRNEMAKSMDESDKRYTDLKLRLTKKIDKISKLNQRLFRERDALREMVDEGEAATIPTAEDELASEMPAGGEGESDEDQTSNLYDEFYVQEKVREAKKEVEDRYSALLKDQQEMLTKSREWDLERQRRDIEAKFDAKIAEVRQGFMKHIADLKEKAAKGNIGTDEIDEMLNEVVVSARQQEEMKHEVEAAETMVPLSEVQKQLEEMRQKLLDVNSENTYLKRAVEKAAMGNVTTDENGTDIIKAMRESVAEQATEMNLVLKENEDLKSKVMDLESRIEKMRQANLQDLPVSLPTVPGGLDGSSAGGIVSRSAMSNNGPSVKSEFSNDASTEGDSVEADIGEEIITLFNFAKKLQDEARNAAQSAEGETPSDQMCVYISTKNLMPEPQHESWNEEQRAKIEEKEKQTSEKITKLLARRGGSSQARRRKRSLRQRRVSSDSLTTESSEVFDVMPPAKRNRVSFEFGSVRPSREQIMKMRQREEEKDTHTIKLGSDQYNSSESLGDGIEPDDSQKTAAFGASLDGSPSPFGRSLDGSPTPFTHTNEKPSSPLCPPEETGTSLDGSPSPFGRSLDGSPSPFGTSLDGSPSPFGTSLDGSPSPFGQGDGEEERV